MENLLFFNKTTLKKPYGCLIYASESVRNFAATEELARFIKLNYPDSALPEMVDLEMFYTQCEALPSSFHYTAASRSRAV